MTESFSTDEQYLSKLNYPYLLLLRIMKILDAIDQGYDAQSETENLLAILKPSWIQSIRSELEEKEMARDRLIAELRKNYENMGSATYHAQIRAIHHGFARWVVRQVIEIMDKNKMLLIEERQIREGGYI